MGIVKSAADLFYTFRFLKLLATPFNETDAYKAGIIDDEGKKRKDFDMLSADNKEVYARYYTPFHRLVYNVKRFLSNAPGGKSKLASYAAVLYLIRENFGVSDKSIQKGLQSLGIDQFDLLSENNHWFVLEDKRLSPGIYRLKNDKIINESYIEIIKAQDKIRVENYSYPIGEIFGLNIYEAIHIRTMKKIYITSEEILK